MAKAATLRMLDRADKEVMKLSRAEIGAVYEFMHKFRHNPGNPGLRLKQLSGSSRLWSARINQDHRALLLHITEHDYLLVAIRHRKDVYENLDRYSYRINRVTGGIEVIDLEPVGDSIVGRVISPDSSVAVPEVAPVGALPASGPQGEASHDGGAGDPAAGAVPLFERFTDTQLVDLGVAEPLLPQIRDLTGETGLLELAERAPQLTTDVLLSLHDGKSYDHVRTHITEPVRAEEVVDPDDYRRAVERPATQVSSDDEALQAMLAESFDRWQIFLHPTQRRLVEKQYKGPTRVGGGPGTGKTIVALHRVAYLVRKLPPGADKPVLLTTFNRNLAADLRTRLIALGGQELVSRVDIVNIDRLASRVVAEAKAGTGKRIVDDSAVPDLWQQYLLETGESGWDAEFLAAEWAQVILGQVLGSRTDYFNARRPGRGRSLSRVERDQIWRLTERFTKWLDDQGRWTWRQVAERAARLEMDRAERSAGLPPEDSGGFLRHRYRHIVVDEAQDLSAAHWKMLRAMVAAGPDDLFLTGDTHQRIYDNHVTLSSLGINIRGRSARLTLSYRTTRQILAAALEIMSGETYDDLDGGAEDLAGYRSLLRGGLPTFRSAASWHQERELVIDRLTAWGRPADGSVAVAVPTRELAAEVAGRLEAEGILAVEIGPDGPKRPDGVHVGTMHRFKGLEYQRVIIAGVSDGLVPRQMIGRYRETDPRRHQRERQRDRSLLFVAATRARDELAVFWHGTPSPFLTGRLVQTHPIE
ncbi:UvrD-helicase domain-containing protein [Plantactinospora sp. KLBMP9567]|uniref:UvrD-helicase domain-containing protein n=1 Tax=Plantactinospora sp. KLBMP9567 TaxID=3085900 RepID=UPI002980B1E6|nr:UvrD-helicase domain-containing protein [Plantactinospora sp. KLBMP9567]MDW5329069.1 UvrD-helicase domain-containing protein [Plantactinospora sp. KLBMP9567]